MLRRMRAKTILWAAIRRRGRHRQAAALAAGVAVLLAADAASAAWRWPVRGTVITPFAVGADRFAAGQHRGIDIAARAGEAVRAPCGGRVAFAGQLPGRGRGVTIACGRLRATILELGSVRIARGDRIVPGATIGRAAASHVQLGARRAGIDHGYIDPMTLLADDPSAPLPVAPPSGRPRTAPPATAPAPFPPAPSPATPLAPRFGGRPRSVPPVGNRLAPPPSAPPVAARSARSFDGQGSGAAAREVPVAAWVGLGLLALGVPLGAAAQTATRRRRTRVRLPTASVARSHTR